MTQDASHCPINDGAGLGAEPHGHVHTQLDGGSSAKPAAIEDATRFQPYTERSKARFVPWYPGCDPNPTFDPIVVMLAQKRVSTRTDLGVKPHGDT